MEPQSTQRNSLCTQKDFPLKAVTEKIISCAMEVHSTIGPGLLESIYEEALAHEFSLRKVDYERQKEICLRYKDIFIAGHTDNVPTIKKYHSNWELSTLRAVEVVGFLSENGIKAESLSAAGYGEHKPLAANDSESGKAKNRRVEIFLIPKIIKREEPKAP